MHRCSESIAALAAALARAQVELTNPEKSLTATLCSKSLQEGDRTFRYAPLSSGLDMVRKCLGKHEIAVVQTTTIDDPAALVRLTTLLAHASGEWLSSDWPVCLIAELASPQRMGAALTYARRYALFTMVGIAGEDDLDAPDLTPITGALQSTFANHKYSERNPKGYPRSSASKRTEPLSASVLRSPSLDPQESGALRIQLLAELTSIASNEEFNAWTQRALRLKNTMTQEDAQIIEAEFRSRLTAQAETMRIDSIEEFDKIPRAPEPIVISDLFNSSIPVNSDQVPNGEGRVKKRRKPIRSDILAEQHLNDEKIPQGTTSARPFIDKSLLTWSEPRRYRNRAHLKFVASQPCLICARLPSDAHHIRFAQPSALGRRVSDEYTVPLCRTHHRSLHRFGHEAKWWRENKIDPLVFAKQLWIISRSRGSATL